MTTLAELDAAPVGSTLIHREAGSVYTKQDDGRWQYRESGSFYSSRDFLGGATNQLFNGYTLTVPATPAALTTTSELDTYKQRVREVAERYARENGWCDVVEKALEELDIPKPKRVWKVGDAVSRRDAVELPPGTVTIDDRARLRFILDNGLYVRADRSDVNSITGSSFPAYPVRDTTIVYLPESV